MEKPPEAALEDDAVDALELAVEEAEPLALAAEPEAEEPDDALEDLVDEVGEVLSDAEVEVVEELVETDEPLLPLLELLPVSSTVELTQLEEDASVRCGGDGGIRTGIPRVAGGLDGHLGRVDGRTGAILESDVAVGNDIVKVIK